MLTLTFFFFSLSPFFIFNKLWNFLSGPFFSSSNLFIPNIIRAAWIFILYSLSLNKYLTNWTSDFFCQKMKKKKRCEMHLNYLSQVLNHNSRKKEKNEQKKEKKERKKWACKISCQTEEERWRSRNEWKTSEKQTRMEEPLSCVFLSSPHLFIFIVCMQRVNL